MAVVLPAPRKPPIITKRTRFMFPSPREGYPEPSRHRPDKRPEPCHRFHRPTGPSLSTGTKKPTGPTNPRGNPLLLPMAGRFAKGMLWGHPKEILTVV